MKKNNDIEYLDLKNEELCIYLGIHPRNATPRDPSVWTKTPKEKQELKKLRLRHKHDKMFGSIPEEATIPVYDKLILYIKKGPTYSIKCGQSDIKHILNKYGLNNILKYSWNGKTYKPGVLPFWYW